MLTTHTINTSSNVMDYVPASHRPDWVVNCCNFMRQYQEKIGPCPQVSRCPSCGAGLVQDLQRNTKV